MAGDRLVRCPTCRQLLKEPAGVLVYKCGGCDTMLQAKTYTLTRKNATSGAPDSNPANSPVAISYNDIPSSLPKESTTHLAVKYELGMETSQDPESSTPINASDNQDNSKLLENKETGIVEKISDTQHLGTTDKFGSRRNDSGASDVINNDGKLQEEAYNSFNAEAKESVALFQQGHDNLNPIHEMQGSAEYGVTGAVSDYTDKATASDEHNSDDSFSSCDDDDQSNDQTLTALSSQQIVEDSQVHDTADNTGCKERKRNSLKHDQSGDTENQFQASVPQQNTSVDMELSTGKDESFQNISDKPTKIRSSAQKDAPLDTKDFRSMKNRFEFPMDYARSLSADAIFHRNQLKIQHENLLKMYASISSGQKEIVTKIDELRDEVKTFHLKESREKESFRHMKLDYRSHHKANRSQGTAPQQSRFARFPAVLPPTTSLNSHNKPCKKLVKSSPGIYYSSSSGRASSHYLHDTSFSSVTKMKKAPSRPVSYHYAQISDQHRQNAHFKEKRQQSKHHCRPILGGAPFIICYNCLELLQVPMEAEVSKKRLHKLRCSACSQVVIFQSQAAEHSIPQTPIEVPHPPSEADGSTDNIDPRHEMPAGSYSLVGFRRDPVSYQEESSSKFSNMNNKTSINSRLHRLMGYDSASELLYKHSDSDEGLGNTKLTYNSVGQVEERFAWNRIKGKSKV